MLLLLVLNFQEFRLNSGQQIIPFDVLRKECGDTLTDKSKNLVVPRRLLACAFLFISISNCPELCKVFILVDSPMILTKTF